MKKKLLFVIDSLNIGGAEKSLVSLLNMIDSSKYHVDLLLFKNNGDLERYVPTYVNILPLPRYFSFVGGQRFSLIRNAYYTFYKLKTSLNLRINNYRKKVLHSEQVVFRSIRNILEPLHKEYDVAIAYSQGMPTYFVSHRVKARKKAAWINTDYINTLYDIETDYDFYKNMDYIIAVSEYTRDSISGIKQEYADKIKLVLDIVNPDIIYEMAREYQVKEFSKDYINILTVGRLVDAKGYDKAIKVAKMLKEDGYKFKWFAVGEGPQRTDFQKLIDEYNLNDYFYLLGKKVNPYPYMRNCDIYVQTSVMEGFGLTVSEAKILKKPIVCTEFPTAKEILHNNVDGIIVKHEIESIYNAIKKYIDEDDFQKQIVNQLYSIEPYSSVDQIENIYQIIEA